MLIQMIHIQYSIAYTHDIPNLYGNKIVIRSIGRDIAQKYDEWFYKYIHGMAKLSSVRQA